MNTQSALGPGVHRLRVSQVVTETADAVSVHFEIPLGLQREFHYTPGQFITLRLPIGARIVPRCYSMSSAPGLDEGLRVTVKRVAGGRGSNWIADQLRPGSELEVLAPSGRFTPPSLDEDLLLLAGGSGITPVLSILRAVLAQGGGKIRLFYANRNAASVIFASVLADLSREHPQRLSVTHWLDELQGAPTQAQLQAFASPGAAQRAFICGPAPFMAAAGAALVAAGLPEDQVHVERFASLPDEPAQGANAFADESPSAGAPAISEAAGAAAGPAARCQVRLAGEDREIAVAPGQNLLQALSAAGLQAPHSCKAGLCGSCMCRLLEGQVRMPVNEALSERDVQRGWILACQAQPTTDHLRIQFNE